jgi:hypothetical protein
VVRPVKTPLDETLILDGAVFTSDADALRWLTGSDD